MIDFAPPPKTKLWTPPKPAIIRAAPDILADRDRLARAVGLRGEQRRGFIPGMSEWVPVGGATKNLYQILTDLSLTTNLVACFDAGASSSYGGSGQTFSSLVGTDHLYLGATSGSEASDPTFNGSAGSLADNTYFGFDGGDYFIYQAQPSWVQSWHKDNAVFTILFVLYLTSASSSVGMIGNSTGSSANVGFSVYPFYNNIRPRMDVVKGSSGNFASNYQCTSVAIPTNQWALYGLSLNEPAGAAGSFHYAGGSAETFDGTYTTPSSSSATYTTEIAAPGNGGAKFANGDRLAMFAAWSGSALTSTNIGNIKSALVSEGRYSSLG